MVPRKRIATMIDRYQAGILAVVVMYVIAMIGQSLLGWLRETKAEAPLATHRLVAVLVQEDLIDEVRDDVEWYTKTYMPERIDNVMPLIITIHEDYTPYDIQNTLENLYFEGLIDKPSTLEGMVMIGDIPLPIVWDQNTSHQSVFPYVDFEDVGYRWSEPDGRFVSTSAIMRPQAEIWHGLMTRGDDPVTYESYFAKLRTYADDPSSFVDKKIWVDDFTTLPSVMDPDKYSYYFQQSIFAEDINYHRYTPLLLSLLQGTHNERVANALSDMSEIEDLPLAGDGSDEFVSALNEYTSFLSDELASDDTTGAQDESSATPTLLLEEAIDALLLTYPELLSQGYRSEREEMLLSAGRRTGDQIDSHIQKLFVLDHAVQGTSQIPGMMTKANTLLESALIDIIDQNEYAVPYPLFVGAKQGGEYELLGPLGPIGASCYSTHYEAMYHGRNGLLIDQANELSIYQGTYGNHVTLSGLMSDPMMSSVGASYGILDTQTEANRGYNMLYTGDQAIASDMNAVDSEWCEDMQFDDFMQAYRGGNTLFNITNGTGGEMVLGDHSLQRARHPYRGHNYNIGGPVFDQAGSHAIDQEQSDAYSYQIARDVSIQKVNKIRRRNIFDDWDSKHMPFCDADRFSRGSRPYDFFAVWPTATSLELIGGATKGGYDNCESTDWRYTYKLIDSTVINASPTPEQITAMNIATPDRPIDSDHTVTFQGLSADVVTLEIPNLWDVQVFDTMGSGDQQVNRLLEPSVIEDNIRSHLRDVVASYNAILTAQNQDGQDRFVAHQAAYNFLGASDPRASVNRTYDLLSDDFLIDTLGDNYIKQAAAGLYRHNLPRKQTTRKSTIADDIQVLGEQGQLDYKIAHILEHYLDEEPQTNWAPGYHSTGYEAVVLHSDTNNTAITRERSDRDFADRIRTRRRSQSSGFASTDSPSDQQAIDDASLCGYVPGTPVPLVGPWLDALDCWRTVTAAKPFDVSVRMPDITERGQQELGNFMTSWDEFGESFQQEQDSIQTVSNHIADEEATNEELLDEIDPSLRAPLRRVYNNLNITWSDSVYTIDELDDITLMVTSQADVPDDVTLSLSSTGAQCLILDNQNTCTTSLSIDTATLDESGQAWSAGFSSLQAGMIAAELSICSTSADICLQKSTPLTLMPGQMTDASLVLMSATVAAGGLVPLRLHATDSGGNKVGTQPLPLTVTSQESWIENGPQTMTTTTTMVPNQTTRRYRTPTATASMRQTRADDGIDRQTQDPQLTFDTLSLTQSGTSGIAITYDTTDIISTPATIQSTVTYDGNMSETLSIGLDTAMVADDVTTLPHLVVTVRDTQDNPLSDQLFTLDTNTVKAHIINENGETPPVRVTDQNGQINAYIVPHGSLGDSVITTQLYRSEQSTKNTITRGVGDPYMVTLDTDADALSPGEQTLVDLTLTDERGNRIDDNTDIRLVGRGPMSFSGDVSSTIVDVGDFPITVTANDRGQASIVAMIDGVSIDKQMPDVHEWTIAEDLITFQNLNTMTLSLDGRGRGDYSTGDDKQAVQDAFATSEKLLAFSTTLTAPDTIGTGGYIAPWLVDAMPGESVANLFQDDSTPITDWAQGSHRGEAHRPYSTPLMVVYGDPLLHTIGDEPSEQVHDTERGKRIYTDPQKAIDQTLVFDFNADQLEDILVVHTDGSIYILKNYGGQTQPYVDMGPLLLIDADIKEIFVGDIDANGYDDIMIRTDDNQVRAYTNDGGVIDVDGYPVCLPVPGGPDRIENAHQLFVRDMDLDGALDIVTNDTHGIVAITYGGSDAPYLSRDRLVCDDDREDRTTANRTIVTQMGIELTSDPVRDSSLIHRQGLTYTSNEVGNTAYSGPSQASLDNMIDDGQVDPSVLNQLLTEQMTTDTDELVAASVGEAYRYIASPMRFIPGYYGDDEISYSDLYYVPAYSQRDTDPITIEKTYNDHDGGLLLPGDTVTVTVTANAAQDTTITYLDYGRGARSVEKETDRSYTVVGQSIKTFDRSQINGDYVYRDAPSPAYLYMLDNLSFTAGQTRVWSYDLTYQGGPLVDIDIRTFNDDDYPDIIISPVDSCRQIRQEWVNENINEDRTYTGTITDLSETQDEATSQGQEDMNNAQSDLVDGMQDAIASEDPSALDVLQEIGEVWGQDFFSDYMQGGNFWDGFDQITQGGNQFASSLELDVPLDPAIMESYQDITQGLCQGFGVGEGCGGLPVPFNMAFLAPGDLQVMGCKIFEDKGLPTFFFPGTLQTPIGPVPFPYGLKGPGDGFYRAPGGVYPSQIRIYTAPTLTQQLGVAMCLGPYAVGANIPAPFKNLGGNCIVTAIDLKKGCSDEINEDIRPDGANSLTDDWYDIAQRGTCTNPAAQVGHMTENPPTTSPFVEATRDAIVDTWDNPGHDNNGFPPASSLHDGPLLGGMLFLDQDPVTIDVQQENQGNTAGVSLVPGQDTNNQIKGGNGGGLAQCIVQGWLDPQITYIANNLTTLNITVYLPDLRALTQGLNTVTAQNINNIRQTPAIATGDTQTMGQAVTTPTTSEEKLIDAIGIQKNQIEGLDSPLNNPFTKLEQVFQEIPLINISKQTVPITIPMLTDEGITAYEASLHEWITHNTTIAKERKDMGNAVIDICGAVANMENIGDLNAETLAAEGEMMKNALTNVKNTSSDPKTVRLASSCLDVLASGKLQGLITFQQDMSRIMQVVQSNLAALRTYKEFPSQLTALLGSIDRYVVDAASFITDLFGQINERLGTNARIFNAYVDAIISMKIAVSTRQALIDLSVNRKQSCSTCSNDNYGAYSCNLQFMCPSNLPILKFPPLKIPDIYIDLSHIDAGVEMTLPEISFVSKAVTLPTLPTIPQPPVMEVDITIGDRGDLAIEESLGLITSVPDIPSLPTLPTLPPAPDIPDLPPLIPEVDMTLPYLPPPPEIPSLSPSIQQMISVGETIGKLYCIMKGEIGLVAEAGVKSKIEQLTQRTRNVPIFDYFNLTHLHDAPTLEGMDLRVDSMVDFNMNIDSIYAILDSVASVTNKITNQLIAGGNMMLQEGADAATDTANELDDYTNIELQGSIPQTDWDDLLTSIELVQDERSAPSDELSYLASIAQQRQSSHDHATYDQTILQKQQQTLMASFDTYRSTLTTIQDGIDPGQMDSVLALVDKQIMVPVDDQSFIAYLNIPDSMDAVRELHPARDYLDGRDDILASYQHDITNNSATDLMLTQESYQQMRKTVTQTKSMVAGLVDATDTRPSFASHHDRFVQNTSTASSSEAVSYDYSQYLQGTYYLSGDVAYDILESTYREDQIVGYLQTDINNDNDDDIMLWDANSIYIKYAHHQDNHQPHLNHGNEGDVRYIDMGAEKTNVDTDGSITSLYNERFRVGSPHAVVHELKTQGQSYDTISVSWSDSAVYGGEYDGYMMRFVQRVDVHHDDAHRDAVSPSLREQYLLVMSSDAVTPGYIRLERDQGYESVQSLVNQGRLTIRRTTLPTQTVTITLDDVSRNRHYVQVAHMITDDMMSSNGSSMTVSRLTIASPRSTQAVAGPQIIADDNPPLPQIELQREQKNYQVVGSGLELAGYVGTYYTLDIQRDDPSGTQNNRIRRPDGDERVYSGGTASWSGLFFTGDHQYQITIGAEDTQDNVGERAVMLRIDNPDISIIDVETSGQTGTITAELSQDIDDGMVQFDHSGIGDGVWTTLSGTEGVSTPVITDQIIITGGIYTIGDMIGFYDDSGDQIASMDPHTGQIQFTQTGYEVIGLWHDHYARWVIRTTTTQTPLFEVTLPIQAIIAQDSLHPGYTRQTVSIGDFTQCLIYDNQCIVARDTENHLVIPAPHNYAYYATYGFDTETNQIQMTIVRQSDDQPVAYVVTESVGLLPSTE